MAVMGTAGTKTAQKRTASVLPLLGTGRFDVGCAEIMVDDDQNGDIGTLATIYYPSSSCEPDSKLSEHPLWLPRHEYIDGLAEYRNTSARRMHFMHRWFIGEKRIAAHWHSELDSTVVEYPILIFSHGLSACRHFYSIYCSSVASHGYVVAAIEHRDRSACWTYTLKIDDRTGKKIEVPIKIRKLTSNDDEFQLRNRQLHKRVAECVKTLHVLEELNLGQYSLEQQVNEKLLIGNDFMWSQFKGRLDMSRIFIAGHSFGGATAIAAAAFSTDFSALVVLDGWMFPIEKELLTCVQQPVLFMNAENFQWAENVKDMLRVIENSKCSFLLTFNEAGHHWFTDFPLLVPGLIGRWLAVRGSSNPVRFVESVIELTARFLKPYCGADSSPAAFDLLGYEDVVTKGTKFARESYSPTL